MGLRAALIIILRQDSFEGSAHPVIESLPGPLRNERVSKLPWVLGRQLGHVCGNLQLGDVIGAGCIQLLGQSQHCSPDVILLTNRFGVQGLFVYKDFLGFRLQVPGSIFV